MNMVQLQCFLSVARTLNFTRSAGELFFTQSSLSKNIAALEKELGFQLFERNSHSVQLTEQGACFAREIRSVPDLVSRAANCAREVGTIRSCELTVGVLEGYEMKPELMELFYGFGQMYPQVHLRYERHGFGGLADGMRDGTISLAITLLQMGPLGADCEKLLLERCPANLVISRRNPLAAQPQVTPADCNGMTLITLRMDESAGSYHSALSTCRRFGCEPGHVVECPNVESQFLELEAGDGMAIMDARCRINRSDYVVTYPIKGMTYDVNLFWRAGDAEPELKLLMEYLRRNDSGFQTAEPQTEQ